MGTRHRAGLGMSENSDAIVVIVSEETGIISMAKNGVLIRRLDRQNLFNLLQEGDRSPLRKPRDQKASPLQKAAAQGRCTEPCQARISPPPRGRWGQCPRDRAPSGTTVFMMVLALIHGLCDLDHCDGLHRPPRLQDGDQGAHQLHQRCVTPTPPRTGHRGESLTLRALPSRSRQWHDHRQHSELRHHGLSQLCRCQRPGKVTLRLQARVTNTTDFPGDIECTVESPRRLMLSLMR